MPLEVALLNGESQDSLVRRFPKLIQLEDTLLEASCPRLSFPNEMRLFCSYAGLTGTDNLKK
jgi:hypothetical protein